MNDTPPQRSDSHGGWLRQQSNPTIRAPPPQSHDEHRQCNPGGGIHFAVLLGSDNSCTTPFEIPFLIRSPSWWQCIVGGPLNRCAVPRNFLLISFLKRAKVQLECCKWQCPLLVHSVPSRSSGTLWNKKHLEQDKGHVLIFCRKCSTSPCTDRCQSYLVARTRCVSFALRCVSKFRPAAYSASRVEFLLRGLSCRMDSARIFPISRQKVAHQKTHRKTLRKTECFHRILPRILGVCFSAVRTVIATEKRPPKNSDRNPSRHRAKSRVPMWQGWKPLNMPIGEAKIIKTENFFSSQFCTSLPSKFL